MADLPLSKTLDPRDFDQLTAELTLVDRFFRADAPQHPLRRWEYAMALHACWAWQPRGRRTYTLDIGGAGSPFWRMLKDDPATGVLTIDPALAGGMTFERYRAQAPEPVDAIFALSVLEHADDLLGLLAALTTGVKRGGLVFLTMDYCDSEAVPPVDRYHFAWMRKRIFNRAAVEHLLELLALGGLEPTGPTDYTWHGPHVYDYTFASLALVKRTV